MDNNTFDKNLIAEAVELAEEHMKRLHAMPERALEETETTAYIRKVAESYPVRIADLNMKTGLLCCLDAGKEQCIALRADIDALPTDEGVKHLCGHDAHAAALLGAMHYLCNVSSELNYNIAFIFQPAEEGVKGAKAMLAAGLMDKLPGQARYLFGIHNWPHRNCGEVVVHRGALMSQKSTFKVVLKGRSGHGSVPHKCIDPIVAAAAFINGVQTVISRNTDPFADAICAINSVRAGREDIPSPDSSVVTGYIRSFDADAHSRMEERIKTLAEGTAEAYECACSVEIVQSTPAVFNSDDMYEVAYKAAERAVGSGHITDDAPTMASEDFAVLGQHIPSFFYWVGSGEPARENAPWHDKDFRIGDDYFEAAIKLLCASSLL